LIPWIIDNEKMQLDGPVQQINERMDWEATEADLIDAPTEAILDKGFDIDSKAGS
jgi:hypothetical protein